MSEQLEARIAALEAEIARLKHDVAAAQGEALYAGQIAPLVLSALTVEGGPLSRERARELIDLALLHFEEAQAGLPAAAQAIGYACRRFLATIETLGERQSARHVQHVPG